MHVDGSARLCFLLLTWTAASPTGPCQAQLRMKLQFPCTCAEVFFWPDYFWEPHMEAMLAWMEADLQVGTL